jgi:hydroxyacylglutathione hydrolase
MSSLDVRAFTVGPVQENAYIVRASSDQTRAVMIDPGEEADRLLEEVEALGVKIEAILLTHCHFDHIGAVAPVARATGAPVYCPKIELSLLTDIMSFVPPGFGPFESYQPEHTVAGGERLTLAGLEIDVLFTPGHSPGHVTYAIDGHPAAFSGDVLFQGSVGRVDLPGGDWNVLEGSIAKLLDELTHETVVYPGHMGVTTLGRELQSNPFLAELRAAEPRAAVASDTSPGGAAQR